MRLIADGSHTVRLLDTRANIFARRRELRRVPDRSGDERAQGDALCQSHPFKTVNTIFDGWKRHNSSLRAGLDSRTIAEPLPGGSAWQRGGLTA